MQWIGEGLIIGVRRHGETSVIAEAMVEGRGRHLGLVRGGRGPKLAATLQVGNSVQLTWRARLEEHLGTFGVEVTGSRAAALITDREKLYAAQLLAGHLRLLPERAPHDRLLGLAIRAIDGGATGITLGAELARFELILLDELGFGLDLSSCAATGTNQTLAYVSPKSGRAVSAAAGEPYRDRLLALPAFLIANAPVAPHDVANAFKLTGLFLDRHVWSPRQIAPPPTREPLIDMLTQMRMTPH